MSDPRGQDTEVLALAGSLHNAFLLYTERVGKIQGSTRVAQCAIVERFARGAGFINDAAGAHTLYGWMPYLRRLGRARNVQAWAHNHVRHHPGPWSSWPWDSV
jgi:hypothetical protein